jgi:hypothetical protein
VRAKKEDEIFEWFLWKGWLFVHAL